MTVIDLGEVGFQPPEPDPRPLPKWLRRLGAPTRGKAAAFSALVLLAGGVAGVAPDPGPQPRFHTIPAVDIRGSFWSADGVFLQLSPDARSVTATGLESGAILWSKAWGPYISQMDRAVDGSVLLQTIKTMPGSGDTTLTPDASVREIAGGEVHSVDIRTGVQRWHRPGALLSPWGSPELIILQPPANAATAAAGPAESAANGAAAGKGEWAIVRLDVQDGRELWRLPVRDSTRWTFTYDNDFTTTSGGLVLMDALDGSVTTVDGDGHATPRGRVRPGGTLEWAWSAYLAVSHQSDVVSPTDGPPLRLFALHDLRTLSEQPLWTVPIDMLHGGAPWPCGQPDRICMPDGSGFAELAVRDGSFLGQHPDTFSFDPNGITAHPGVWSSVGGWRQDGNQLVAAPPEISKTGVAWLGAIRRRNGKEQVIPLMTVPMQIVNCWYSDEVWIICNGVQSDGTAWDRSLVLRQSDVDDLVRRLGGP